VGQKPFLLTICIILVLLQNSKGIFKSLMSIKANQNIGLALGGGAVLGAAHIGVIRALEESRIPVKYISGTSIGALVAAMFAFGKSWKEIRSIAMEVDWIDISRLAFSRNGLLSNKKMGKLITDNLGDVTFEDTEIPLAIVATDITSGEKVVIKKGSITTAILASTSIPGLFVPVETDNRLLVDGGIAENVPVLSARDMGAEYIIGVDLNAKQNFTKPKNIVQVLINTVHLTLRNVTQLQTEEADLLITPDLSEFDYYHVKQIPELIEKGYAEAMSVIEKNFDKAN
jgi:NTE family protein